MPKTTGLNHEFRELILTAGIYEIDLDNIESARLRLNQLRNDPWVEQMEEGYKKSLYKWRALFQQVRLVSELLDWVELERLARAMLVMEIRDRLRHGIQEPGGKSPHPRVTLRHHQYLSRERTVHAGSLRGS